jgi:hypothetical protein
VVQGYTCTGVVQGYRGTLIVQGFNGYTISIVVQAYRNSKGAVHGYRST